MAYNALVEIQIVRRADNARVFRGKARALGAGNQSVAVLVERSLTQLPAAN